MCPLYQAQRHAGSFAQKLAMLWKDKAVMTAINDGPQK